MNPILTSLVVVSVTLWVLTRAPFMHLMGPTYKPFANYKYGK